MTALSDEFAEIKREIHDESLDADKFVQLTANIEQIKENLRQLEEKSKTKESIELSFTKSARLRNDELQRLYQAYQDEIKRINDNPNKLRIEIIFKGDRDGFKTKLKNDFRGTGISDGKYQTLSEKFTDYVALIEDWILSDGKELRSILSTSEYSKLDTKLREQYVELLKYQVENKVDIYYHDKLLRQHSIGQRASALILFILSQNTNDIILIDQPEDDLDNRAIYTDLVSYLRDKKTKRQIILVTHNPNIVVGADSELVIVANRHGSKNENPDKIKFCYYGDTLESSFKDNDEKTVLYKQGIKEHICEILEGGDAAFKLREKKYGYDK